MEASVQTMRRTDRLAAAFLLVLMTVGSLVLWIGVPLGCLYVASKLADTLAEHFVIVLPMAIAAMCAWGWFLFWLNGLYLRITGFFDEQDPDEPPRRIRGPLEPIIVGSLIIALVALFVWFFGFAENPSSQVI